MGFCVFGLAVGFDNVYHQKCIKKLISMLVSEGGGGGVAELGENGEDRAGESYRARQGVPQGPVLGPGFFLVCVTNCHT